MLSLPSNVSELIYSQLYMSELWKLCCVSRGYNESVKNYMNNSKLRSCKCGCEKTRDMYVDYVENCVLTNSKIKFTNICWIVYKDILCIENSFRKVYRPECDYLIDDDEYMVKSLSVIDNKKYMLMDEPMNEEPESLSVSDCLLKKRGNGDGMVGIIVYDLDLERLRYERACSNAKDKKLYKKFQNIQGINSYLLLENYEDMKDLIYKNDNYLPFSECEFLLTCDNDCPLSEYLLNDNMNSMNTETTSSSYKDWLNYMNENVEDDKDNSVDKLTEDLMSKLRICRENRRIKLGYIDD